MNTLVLIFSAIVAAVLAVGPGNPVDRLTAEDCQKEGEMFADDDNMCWFHQCVNDVYGFKLMPRMCGRGSKLDYYYVTGMSNPCTVNMDTNIGYECERTGQSVDVAPACASDGSVTCYNGGTLTYESSNCWCLCPAEWDGDFDCSKPPGYYGGLDEGSNICRDGVPEGDNCAEVNYCENGGTCYNQCRGYWCECPDDELFNYLGRRCETSYKK